MRRAWDLLEGRWLPAVLIVALGLVALLLVRGRGRYSPPDYGGPEPFENHRAAVEILATGRTTMTFHPPGYAYLVAATYAIAPPVPFSVLVLQVLMLPVLVEVGALAARDLGSNLEQPARWAIAAYFPFAYFASVFNSIFPTTLAIASAAVLAKRAFDRPTVGRTALAGLLIGVSACLRPNFALAGAGFVIGLWLSRKSLMGFVKGAAVAGVVGGGLFAVVNTVNAPSTDQSLRGGYGLWAGILVGTYQYEYQWWDWDWYYDESYRGFREYKAELSGIEHRSGKPVTHPASEPLLREAALRRLRENPGRTFKKMLISLVRIWVLVPTHLQAGTARVFVGVLELAVLGLGVIGLFKLRRSAFFWFAFSVIAIPMITHVILHVEPRYSLPAKPFIVIAALAGVRAIMSALGCTVAGLDAEPRGEA
ncbi:MAG: hypothetical protein IT186_20580 [Acidobacteria bacterium]|nr:hypothetical protein [Acidobacteriota bacterium]